MQKHNIKTIEEMRSFLGKADLHIHSNFSDARPSIEQILNYTQRRTDLNIIAITDHDTIDGALFARKLMKGKKYHFELIVGEEISCKEGHVIGLFLKKAIKPGISAKQAIANIKKQGGIVLMPHPLRHVRVNTGDKNVDGVGFMTLIRERKNIDAVEVINATPTMHPDNIKSMFFNDSLLFAAEVGGSDAHILSAIGMGYTVFEGRNVADLKNALLSAQTKALNKRWKFMGLIQYLFFFLPKGLRLFLNTLFHGRRPKRLQIINFPKHWKGSEEVIEFFNDLRKKIGK